MNNSTLGKRVKQLQADVVDVRARTTASRARRDSFVDPDVTSFLRQFGDLDETFARAITLLKNTFPGMYSAANVVEDHDDGDDFVLVTVFVPGVGDVTSDRIEEVIRGECQGAEELLKKVTFSL